MNRKRWIILGAVLACASAIFVPALYSRKIIGDATREFDRIRRMFDHE